MSKKKHIYIEEGNFLKKEREKKEFTLRQLAEHTGINWQKLTYCEKGTSGLTKIQANKIGRVLSIATDKLPILPPKKKDAKPTTKKSSQKETKTTDKTDQKTTSTKKSSTISITGVKFIDDKSIILISGTDEYHFQLNKNIKEIIANVLKG